MPIFGQLQWFWKPLWYYYKEEQIAEKAVAMLNWSKRNFPLILTLPAHDKRKYGYNIVPYFLLSLAGSTVVDDT